MVRRIVTGHKDGKAVFLGDGLSPGTFVSERLPGLELSWMWATPEQPCITTRSEPESIGVDTRMLPYVGETRLLYLQLPPDSTMLREDFDAAAAGQEFAQKQPEMAAVRELKDPAMHRTDSIDYVIVLEGEVYLELDDQSRVLLKPNDMVVQNGTRHAWRNGGDRPVKLAVIMLGARRVDGASTNA